MPFKIHRPPSLIVTLPVALPEPPASSAPAPSSGAPPSGLPGASAGAAGAASQNVARQRLQRAMHLRHRASGPKLDSYTFTALNPGVSSSAELTLEAKLSEAQKNLLGAALGALEEDCVVLNDDESAFVQDFDFEHEGEQYCMTMMQFDANNKIQSCQVEKSDDGRSVLDIDTARSDSDTESEAATSRTTSRSHSPNSVGMDMDIDLGGAGQGRQASEDRAAQSAPRSDSGGRAGGGTVEQQLRQALAQRGIQLPGRPPEAAGIQGQKRPLAAVAGGEAGQAARPARRARLDPPAHVAPPAPQTPAQIKKQQLRIRRNCLYELMVKMQAEGSGDWKADARAMRLDDVRVWTNDDPELGATMNQWLAVRAQWLQEEGKDPTEVKTLFIEPSGGAISGSLDAIAKSGDLRTDAVRAMQKTQQTRKANRSARVGGTELQAADLSDIGFNDAQIQRLRSGVGAENRLPVVIQHAENLIERYGFTRNEITSIAVIGGGEAVAVLATHIRSLLAAVEGEPGDPIRMIAKIANHPGTGLALPALVAAIPALKNLGYSGNQLLGMVNHNGDAPMGLRAVQAHTPRLLANTAGRERSKRLDLVAKAASFVGAAQTVSYLVAAMPALAAREFTLDHIKMMVGATSASIAIQRMLELFDALHGDAPDGQEFTLHQIAQITRDSTKDTLTLIATSPRPGELSNAEIVSAAAKHAIPWLYQHMDALQASDVSRAAILRASRTKTTREAMQEENFPSVD